jgi:MoxR-like ATPase
MEPEDATIIAEFVETKETEKPKPVKETKKEVKDEFSELEYKKKIRLEHKVIGAEDELRALENAVLGDHATLLIGDTGVGKTYRIQALAKKHDKKMVRVSLNGEIGINEL